MRIAYKNSFYSISLPVLVRLLHSGQGSGEMWSHCDLNVIIHGVGHLFICLYVICVFLSLKGLSCFSPIFLLDCLSFPYRLIGILFFPCWGIKKKIDIAICRRMHKTQTYCSKNLKSNNCVIKTSAKKKKEEKKRNKECRQHSRSTASTLPWSQSPFLLRGNYHSDFCGNYFIAFLFIVSSPGNAPWTIGYCPLLTIIKIDSYGTCSFVFGFLASSTHH